VNNWPALSPDLDAPAVITPSSSLSWRQLWASLPPRDALRRQRRGVVGGARLEVIQQILSGLVDGDVVVLGHPRWPPSMHQAAFAAAGVDVAVPAAWAIDEDGGTIVFSSGSTGAPKAILHKSQAHLKNARGAVAVMPFVPGHRWLLSLPPCHVGGLAIVMRAVVGGGAVAIADDGMSLVDSIVALRPSHISLVAAQLRTILQHDDATDVLRAADLVLVGGGPTPRALLESALAAGLPVRQTWGLSEMGSQVCTSEAGAPFTCGVALPDRHVRTGDDGQLWVGGAPRFSGFVHGDTLRAPFDAAGDYATGDVGAFDASEGGGLVVTGRIDNQFISGGENIQPEAIEALLSDADVTVLVVPVPDARFDWRPFAFYDSVLDDDVVLARLRQRAADHLPRFMAPVGHQRLPVASGMKASRPSLRALAALVRQNLPPS
jgi:O-succinylbenzoic acid--CoA ligase